MNFICGIDEAGRGPVIGPMVVAAACAPDDRKLVEMGAKDSKKCTPLMRERLVPQIKKCCEYAFRVVSAEEIDEKRKIMTMNVLEVEIFAEVLRELLEKMKAKGANPKDIVIYADAPDVNEERFADELRARIGKDSIIISRHKADDLFPIVSAASIIAKTTRDALVLEIEKELTKKMPLPLGSGYPSDPLTKRFLNAWVQKFGNLPPHTRKSWETASRLIGNNKTKKLNEF
jgi:ribonuclease HII